MNKTIATIVCVLALASPVWATKIADISHLQGQRGNRLIGIGLVTGLPGTGDSSKYLPSIRRVAAFLNNFGDPVWSLGELAGTKNVALVSVRGMIGENGAREGQTIDVSVSAIGSAKSLKGGRLELCPLKGPSRADPTIYALADGLISLDGTNPTTAMIKGGAVMEEDVINQYLAGAAFTLVIDDAQASWAMASAIAMTINEAVSVLEREVHLATALSPKSVQVKLPKAERSAPASFIAYIQSLPLLMPEKKAQVTINARSAVILIDGPVTISPVTVTYRGMTISTKGLIEAEKQKQVKPNATAEKKGEKSFEMPETDFVELRLLTESLEYLKAPFEDRVAIIRELARSGNLQGQLVE